MKAFLISPDEKAFLWNAGDRVPLGLLYLAAVLEKNGIKNEVFDLNHYDKEELIKRIRAGAPDFVGLSIVSSPSFKQMKKLAEEIKAINPGIKIIVGGAHVSAMPESFIGVADSIVLGYGEKGLMAAIKGKKGIINESCEINDFPVPARSKLNPNDYVMYADGLKTATIITSRGCPFACVFCASHERKIQYRDPESVREEVRELKKQGYETVYILDENFVVSKKHFNAITDLMNEEAMKYRIEMRTSDVSEKIVQKLKKTGCIYVALGIESGNNEILKKANKNTTVEINRRAIEILGKYNIPTKGFFIIGLPGETEETAWQTIKFADEMRAKGLRFADFYSLTPFPGSPVWENPEKYGIKILSRDFDSYLQKGEPVIETEKLSKEKISELVKEAKKRWQKLGRIIITGASGFIGRRVTERLKKDYEIIDFSIESGKDILNEKDFQGLNADYVIHLAALNKSEDVRRMFEVNVKGTLNVLEFCKKNSVKMIFTSSIAVYGLGQNLKEENALKPISFYGCTKLLGERLCEFYKRQYGVNCSILRISNIYGPGQGKGYVIYDALSQINNEKIILKNPFPKRDFIYVDDVVEAIVKCLPLNGLEILNIGSGQSNSVREIAEKMSTNVEFKEDYDVESDIFLDPSRSKRVLDWQPEVSLDEGIGNCKEFMNAA